MKTHAPFEWEWKNVGLGLCLLALAFPVSAKSHLFELLNRPDPVAAVYDQVVKRSVPICDPSTSCSNCNVDVNVGTTLFIHGYASHYEGFPEFDKLLKPQNQCAGYDTYRASVGQDGGIEKHKFAAEIDCRAGEGDGRCIGQCTRRDGAGRCIGFDRSRNGICNSDSRCVRYHDDGAKLNLDTWDQDLAFYFANARLNNEPDRSITVVTHSTGAPAIFRLLEEAYKGDARYVLPASKIKQVITIQGAVGGACGAGTVGWINDPASSDLGDLANNKKRFDFRQVTFDGNVPITHIQSFGPEGNRKCRGQKVFATYTGFSCKANNTHDGVTQNWEHNTSMKHINGAGRPGGFYPYNIAVRDPELGFCHSAGDGSPSYRQEISRFRLVFGRDPVSVHLVQNMARVQPWWHIVLNPWREL